MRCVACMGRAVFPFVYKVCRLGYVHVRIRNGVCVMFVAGEMDGWLCSVTVQCYVPLPLTYLVLPHPTNIHTDI